MNLAAKKYRIIIVTALIFIAVSLIAFIYQMINKNDKINGEYISFYGISFSHAEYMYFFNECAEQYITANAGMLDYTGLKLGIDYSKQYKNTNTDETWEDYFKAQAENDMKDIAFICKAAEKNNYTFDKDNLTRHIENIKEKIAEKAHNTDQTLDAYIGQAYLSGARFRDIRPAIEKQEKAEIYKSYIKEGISYTTEDIFDYYDVNSQLYDIVDYRAIILSTTEYMNALSPEYNIEDYESDEELKAVIYEEATKKLLDDANHIFDNTKSEEDFKAYALEYAPESVKKSANEDDDISLNKNIDYSSANLAYKDWLFDEQRTYGSMCLIKEEQSGNYYLLFFLGRNKNKSHSVSYNHIYISYPISSPIADMSDEDKESGRRKAEKIYKEISEAKPLSQSEFENFADKYNDDYSTKDTHGYKENIYKHNLPASISEWLYSDRLPGDMVLIHDSEGSYILYFISYSDDIWYKNAKNDYINSKYNEKIAKLKEEIEE